MRKESFSSVRPKTKKSPSQGHVGISVTTNSRFRNLNPLLSDGHYVGITFWDSQVTHVIPSSKVNIWCTYVSYVSGTTGLVFVVNCQGCCWPLLDWFWGGADWFWIGFEGPGALLDWIHFE